MVPGDLLVRLDRSGEAGTEFRRAARLTRNARERDFLLERATRCEDTSGSAAAR